MTDKTLDERVAECEKSLREETDLGAFSELINSNLPPILAELRRLQAVDASLRACMEKLNPKGGPLLTENVLHALFERIARGE